MLNISCFRNKIESGEKIDIAEFEEMPQKAADHNLGGAYEFKKL